MEGATSNPDDVRVEVVTAMFVASGVPEGVRDLGRFLENLNNPAIARHIELGRATVRPLYRAASPLELDTPILVRREDIIFATFEGPHIVHDVVRTDTTDSPCLLMAPPFQIQGTVSLAPGASASHALRSMMGSFFAVHGARVYDAEGYMLGEGAQIVVNGAVVQMTAPTQRHIEALEEKADAPRRADRAALEETAEFTPVQELIERAA